MDWQIRSQISSLVEFPGPSAIRYSIIGLMEQFSFRLQGKGGKFSVPELIWQDPIIPTAIESLNSRLW